MRNFRKGDVPIRLILPDSYVSDVYLVVIGYAIYTTRDFNIYYVLAGDRFSKGAINSKGGGARFGLITAMMDSPKDRTRLWVSDSTYCCIRGVYRKTNYTFTQAGSCTSCQQRDGGTPQARIGSPVGLVTHLLNPDKTFFYDNKYKSVKCLCHNNGKWQVNTVFSWTKEVNSISLDSSGQYLYVTEQSNIFRIKSTWQDGYESVIESEAGHNDGRLSTAKVNNPKGMIFVNDDLFLLADFGNNVLRLVDLIETKISSICIPHSNADEIPVSSDITSCKINSPFYFYKKRRSSSISILGESDAYQLFYSGWS